MLLHRRTNRIALGALLAGALVALAPTGAPAAGPAQPWLDTTKSPHDRAVALVAAMTLDEKIDQLHGIGSTQHYRRVDPIDRLHVPPLMVTNGPAGAGPNDSGGLSSPPATALPAPIALAATFDPDAAKAYGDVVGDEVADTGSNFLEGPDVNLSRIPTNGREFEGYGEDPHLVSVISGGFIAGAQRPGVIAESKHFAENNQEVNRNADDAHVDERVMHELELRAFEWDVRNGVGAVMCAYNAVNGVYSCENRHLLHDILRAEWGFDGFVTSDFGATHSTVPSMHAGMDLEMPSASYYSSSNVKQALQAGSLTVDDIDTILVRRFTTELRFGLFEHPPATRPVPVRQHGATARDLSEQSTVLLRNEGGLLPLRSASLHSIAVIGPYAGAAMTGGGGSSKVNPAYTVTPVDGLKRRAGSGVTVTYDDGSSLATAAAAAQSADVAIVMVGETESEGLDRPTLALDAPSAGLVNVSVNPHQDALVEAVAAANPKTVVVVKSGGPVLMPWLSAVPSVLEAWYPGEEDGNAVAAVLFGDVDPSGRLPVTFPASDAQVPARLPQQYPGVPFATSTGTGPADTSFGGFRSEYSEGLFVGYRWYDQQGMDPLFPFGYGLSYARFQYAGLRVARDAAGETVALFDVTNVGSRPGVAVPQVYVGAPDPNPVAEPARELAGTAKVSLAPGETAHVRVPIDPLSASFYSVAAGAWQIESGCHPVTVGTSERQLVLTGATIGDRPECTAPVELPSPYGSPSTSVRATVRRCVSARRFTIHLPTHRRQRLRSVRVYINGRRVAARLVRGNPSWVTIDLRGRPKGLMTVRAISRTRSGRTITSVRRYHTCVPGRGFRRA